MKLYAITENGERRKVKGCITRINGKNVKIKKGSPEWYKAVNEAIRQGVLEVGT